MKKLIASFLLILPLCGCVPAAAVVVGATAGGAMLYDKRSFKTMRSDQHATNVAQYRINHDPDITNHAQISVTVFDGIGLMVGQALTPEIRTKAYDTMSKVQGIKRIYDAVTIAAPISRSQRIKDTYLTSKVRSALLTTSELRSNDIKVITENSVVYLLGAVSEHQADLATQAARKISGVTKVVKVFQYS